MIQNYSNEGLMQNYLAPSYPIFIQMKYLVTNIHSNKSLMNAKTDILHLATILGSQGERFLLATLLDGIEPKEWREKGLASPRVALLSEVLREYTANEGFLSYFPDLIAPLCPDAPRLTDFLTTLASAAKLSLQTQIVIYLACYLSGLRDLCEVGEVELERKLKELRGTGRGVADIPARVLEELLFQLSQNAALQDKLQPQFDFLIEGSERGVAKMYRYLKDEWQFFAAEPIAQEKLPAILIRKVDFLREVGPAATNSLETLKATLADMGPISEEEAFECLLAMAEEKSRQDTNIELFIGNLLNAQKKNLKNQELKKIYAMDLSAKKTHSSWNYDTFIAYCSQTANFKWQNVYACFDRPKLSLPTEDGFVALMRTLERGGKTGNRFKVPQHLFFKKWTHGESQAIFLLEVYRCKEVEVLGLAEHTLRRLQKSVKDQGVSQKQLWGHLDMLQQLVQVAQFKYLEVRELFAVPLSNYSQLLIQSLAEIRPSRGQTLLDQILSQLFPLYLQNHCNCIRLLDNLWEVNQQLVISSICELYKSDAKKDGPMNLSKVLDIAQVIKESLIPLTNWPDYQFSVPLAILAGKREFLHFAPWIAQRIKCGGNPFLKAVLGYIDHQLLTPIRTCTDPPSVVNPQIFLEKAQLSKQLLTFIFQSIFLTTTSQKMNKRNLQTLKRIYKEVCTYFPQMSESQIPDEIQQKAERMFVKIYKKQTTVEAALEEMRRLKHSAIPNEKQLFASMVTFLYSQLRFHLNYPQNQLLITAQLFAGLVISGLIEKKLIQVLLQVLQDDLKEDNKKYTFAKLVIEKIKPTLKDQAQFVEKLLDNNLLLQKDPQLAEALVLGMQRTMLLSVEKEKRLKQALHQKHAPPQPVLQLVPEPQPAEDKKQKSQDYDILVALDRSRDMQMAEKEAKLSRINTICNTIAFTNIDEKVRDLEKVLDSPPAMELLAYNVVFKRITMAGQQVNGTLEIFQRLIEKIPLLDEPVKRITYKILQAWFSLTSRSQNDKKLPNFKSLGSWLGRLTLYRGQPVHIHKLNLKEILVRSYNTNTSRLAHNVSVVLKILEGITGKRDVFKLQNPWLGRVLGTLNEIESKLKEDQQNTRLEIKAFFINADIKKSLLSTSFLEKIDDPLICRLPDYIKLPQDLHRHYLQQNINIHYELTKAVDESIQEIVEPIIDRAVKIAIVTARHLILKDFALDSNPDRIKSSFNSIVKNLAGPLALITCRDPLKTIMNRRLKNQLSQKLSDSSAVQAILSRVIPDNLDLGCALIKKAVIESADESIRKDSHMSIAIEQRTEAMTKGQPFADDSYLKDIPSSVPQQLRPRVGGLSLEEYLIYEEFKKEKKVVEVEKEKETVSPAERALELLSEKCNGKAMQEILAADCALREEVLERVHTMLSREQDLQYCFELCEMMREFVEPAKVWVSFKEKVDVSKKNIANIVRKLVREKYFNESCLGELEGGGEDQDRAISMFQKWLDTAHEEIQPFFQSLQESFNKSQGQIRLFFEYSLGYALQKVQRSLSKYHNAMDTTYIEDYSKLIIISYKLISSNNASLFLEQALQAILSVFTRLLSREPQPFHQRAFFKLFLNLICDATRREYGFHQQKIREFYFVVGRQLQKAGPSTHPSFAFAWLQLIANKYLLPTLLRQDYWQLYYELIVEALRFAGDQLTEQKLSFLAQQIYYKGILRVLLLLLHDFPDFLPVFSLQLVLHIPDRFLQLRSLVLSAVPAHLKVVSPKSVQTRQALQALPYAHDYPRYHNLTFDRHKYKLFISALDNNTAPKLQNQSDTTLQLLVLYLAWPSESRLPHPQAKKLVINLLITSEGATKEKLLGMVLNLIRYPNAVTLFFIDIVTAFAFEDIHEKTRNLLLNRMLEKINIQSAHPWGILYLVNQLQLSIKQLVRLQVPPQILSRL